MREVKWSDPTKTVFPASAPGDPPKPRKGGRREGVCLPQQEPETHITRNQLRLQGNSQYSQIQSSLDFGFEMIRETSSGYQFGRWMATMVAFHSR